jgi:hypothetical protein
LIDFTFVIVPYANPAETLLRLERDLLPAAGPTTAIVAIDNSPEPLVAVESYLAGLDRPTVYRHAGVNLEYGPALNRAVQLVTTERFIYVCTAHGRAYDPTWVDDLLAPLDDARVAAAGSLSWSPIPNAYGVLNRRQPHYHVQGGVFAGRTEAFRRVPYNEQRFRHLGSDIEHDYRLMLEGWTLAEVPTIKSVWRRVVPAPQRWKFVHDSSEDPRWSWNLVTEEEAVRLYTQKDHPVRTDHFFILHLVDDAGREKLVPLQALNVVDAVEQTDRHLKTQPMAGVRLYECVRQLDVNAVRRGEQT